MTRRNTGATQAVRDLVHGRDRDCIICGESFQLQIHHRRPRGAGGTRRPETNLPGNLVLVCSDHHSWLESHRDTARQSGYLVPQNAAPTDVPIIWRGQWVLLDDEGGVTPVEVAA